METPLQFQQKDNASWLAPVAGQTMQPNSVSGTHLDAPTLHLPMKQTTNALYRRNVQDTEIQSRVTV